MQAAGPSSEGIIQRHMKEDGKVRSACSLCQNFCGLIATVEDGKVIKLEGDPDNPRNRGHLCAKGLSGFMNAYSPKRVTKPLLRTNPSKGQRVNPGWKEISWEEAINLVAERLRIVREHAKNELGKQPSARPSTDVFTTNPWSQRILFDTFDHWAAYSGIQTAWLQSLDAFQSLLSAETFCGHAVHPPCYLNTSTFEITVDSEYSKYVLLIAAQAGSIIHYDTMNVARHFAENRPGGIKVVSIDPMAGYAASKAEEWVPIRPGTDAAFILCLIHLLVNEYETYDTEFLKKKTNAPYLVGADGLYVRDKSTQKPLVWDPIDSVAKTFDDHTINDYALVGQYKVGSAICAPGFQVLKEQVRKYKPEAVTEITTVPPETLRRIAREIGAAACIGQVIEVDGITLPYRPVSVVWYRGLSAHRHAFLAGLAAMLLPTLLGAIQVPGSIHGHPPAPEFVTEDGLMASKPRLPPPYPERVTSRPRRIDAFELFPVSLAPNHLFPAILLDPSKFGIDLKNFVWPELMFIYRDNPVKNTYAPEIVVKGLAKIPFVVSFCIDLDETTNSIADVVFPDIHHLEKLGEGLYTRIGEPGYWYGAKPVVHPPFDPPWDKLVNNGQVLMMIAEKVGFTPDVYKALNKNWNLEGTPLELKVDQRYPYEEIIDRRLKTWLGPDKGLDWFMSAQGGLLRWHPSPEEKYRGAMRQGRIHVYFEFMVRAKTNVDRTVKEIKDLDWWDTTDYQPVPDWKPCPAYSERNEEFNLFLINYKIPIMAHSFGRFNPIPMKLVKARKHLDSILINQGTAKKLGIREGDEVIVEAKNGKKQVGVAHPTERIHPEVIASTQHKLRKGIDFNEFTTPFEDKMDFLTGAIDSCILVKVSRLSHA